MLVQNNEKLNPWYITGLADSEGNFSINYNAKSKKVTASFKITQNEDSLNVLYFLKEYFGCGHINIDNRLTKGFKFVISNKKDLLEKIIPHFDKYPLVGSKYLDYLDFKECVLLMQNSNTANLELILSHKKCMNKARSFEERWSYLKNKEFNLNPEWIQGFIDGEGTFQANVINKKSGGINVTFTLEIAQHSRDVFVLKAIIDYLGVGYLKPKYDIASLDETQNARSVSRAVFNQHREIIKFIDKYPLFTRKQLDYTDWKEMVSLKESNKHKTEEGQSRIIHLKLNMNRGRILNSNLFSTDDKVDICNSED